MKKIKAIYHTMNMFNLDVTQKCLIAECWLPEADIEVANQALRRGTERSGNSVPSILNRVRTKATPPTYNKTNVLTGGFQVSGERVLLNSPWHWAKKGLESAELKMLAYK